MSVKNRTAERILRHPSDLPRDHPAFEVAADILPRIGPAEGYLVLIEPEDQDRTLDLPELPTRLDRIPWRHFSGSGRP